MYWIPESAEVEQKDYLRAKVYFSAFIDGKTYHLWADGIKSSSWEAKPLGVLSELKLDQYKDIPLDLLSDLLADNLLTSMKFKLKEMLIKTLEQLNESDQSSLWCLCTFFLLHN